MAEVSQPSIVVEVEPPLAGPISMRQVADAASQANLLMKLIIDRKDRMNIVIAIDLIAPTSTTRRRNQIQNPEMLVKVTSRNQAQVHIVPETDFPSSPGAKAKRSG